jgi:hypothetical protein
MADDSPDVLDVLIQMMDVDRTFYGTVRYLEGSTRSNIFAAHERNRSGIIGLLRQYMLTPAVSTMVVNFPATTAQNFYDSVPVIPTATQIATGTEARVTIPETTCSICQEALTYATRIRACGHCFHHACISQWFTMNPRCPMCRHDVREDLRAASGVPSNEGHSMHTDERS